MKNLNIKTLTPVFDGILLTADRYPKEEKLEQRGYIIDLKKSPGAYKLYQTVLAVGETVRNVSVGDVVAINPKNYIVREFKQDENSVRETIHVRETFTKVEFPIVIVDGQERLLLSNRDILYKFEGEEVDE